LGVTDADPNTWRLWVRLYPLLLIALVGIVLLERGKVVGVAVLLLAGGLAVRVVLQHRST
jgi:hypothetical protein